MLTAQVRNRPYDSVNGGFGADPSQPSFNADTLDRPELQYVSFSLNDPRAPKQNLDSLINGVHLVEPVFRSDFQVPSLGSDLSAAQWQPWYTSHEGIDMGHHLYSGLFHATKSESLVQVNRSFSEIHIGQGSNPQSRFLGSSHFSAKFHKSFARRLFLNFNYRSMSDDGSDERQSNSLKRLDIKLFQRSTSGNRLTYLIYDRPIIEESVGSEIDASQSINLDNGHRSVTLGNSLQFKDSTSAPVKYTLDTRMSYRVSSYNALSNSINTSGSLLVGLAASGEDLTYTHALREYSFKNKLNKNLENGVLALSLDLSQLNQSQGASFNDKYFQGILGLDYKTKLKDHIDLHAEAKLGLFDASGFSNLKANVDYDSEAYSLALRLAYSQSIPSLAARRLVVQDEVIQQENWDNTDGSTIGADFYLKKTKTSFTLENQAYKNVLTISNRGLYEQLDSRVAYWKATLKQDVKLGPFFTEHGLMYQSISDDRLSLPALTYNGKVYLEFNMFKNNMLSRMGVDVSIIPSYDLPDFYAVTGMFYNDSIGKGRDVIILNPYFNAKVGPFKFFVKTVNALHRLRPTSGEPTSIYYPLVAGFPQYDYRIRFGVKWMLLD